MSAVIVIAQVIGAEKGRRLWTDTVLNKCERCVNLGLWSIIPQTFPRIHPSFEDVIRFTSDTITPMY